MFYSMSQFQTLSCTTTNERLMVLDLVSTFVYVFRVNYLPDNVSPKTLFNIILSKYMCSMVKRTKKLIKLISDI